MVLQLQRRVFFLFVFGMLLMYFTKCYVALNGLKFCSTFNGLETRGGKKSSDDRTDLKHIRRELPLSVIILSLKRKHRYISMGREQRETVQIR